MSTLIFSNLMYVWLSASSKIFGVITRTYVYDTKCSYNIWTKIQFPKYTKSPQFTDSYYIVTIKKCKVLLEHWLCYILPYELINETQKTHLMFFQLFLPSSSIPIINTHLSPVFANFQISVRLNYICLLINDTRKENTKKLITQGILSQILIF